MNVEDEEKTGDTIKGMERISSSQTVTYYALLHEDSCERKSIFTFRGARMLEGGISGRS